MAQAKTQTLSLGDHWNNFIERHVGKNKRYATASELVRESLRLLEEKEANSKLENLRQSLIEGEESGDAGELDMGAIRQAAKKEAGLT
jgi:antitoxin ParD1/3/4